MRFLLLLAIGVTSISACHWYLLHESSLPRAHVIFVGMQVHSIYRIGLEHRSTIWQQRVGEASPAEVFLPIGSYSVGFNCVDPNTIELSPGYQCLEPIVVPGDGSSSGVLSVLDTHQYRMECGFRRECEFFVSLTPN
jgi:hypothetical protein